MNLKQELGRKAIHLSSVAYPWIYFFYDRSTILYILICLLTILGIYDYLRIMRYKLGIISFFNTIIRNKERNRFSGAFSFLLASIILVVLLPKDIAILSMVLLVVCDTCAAFFGVLFGKTKIMDKSLEGFLAFLISGIMIIGAYFTVFDSNYPKYYYFIALFGAATAELLGDKLGADDNFIVPLVFATILQGLAHLA